MKTITKIATLALCASLSIGALAGCGKTASKEVVVWGGAEDQTLLTQLVKEFKEANPDIHDNIIVRIQDPWNAQSIVANDPEAAAS